LIVVPKTVTIVGHNAFNGANNLRSIQFISSIEELSFGMNWILTGFPQGTDIRFNAIPCPNCNGTDEICHPGCSLNVLNFIIYGGNKLNEKK